MCAPVSLRALSRPPLAPGSPADAARSACGAGGDQARPASLPPLKPMEPMEPMETRCSLSASSLPTGSEPDVCCHFSEVLVKDLLEKSEQQKQRISHDLNDGLCQEIAAASMFCSVLTKRRGIPKPIAKDLKVIAQLLASMMRQARQIIRDLAPIQFDAFGLIVALGELSLAINRFVACEFLCPAPMRVVDSMVSLNLYQFAQNTIDYLLANCQPSSILIQLSLKGRQLFLEITCDGQKMDGPSGKPAPAIEHHAKCIDATLRMVSPKKGGAKVSCSVALPL